MAASLPPDLRVLCRKLTAIPPAQLPHALPSLISHVLHCKEPLSAPQEQKLKGNAPEAAQLVHKLKTSITTMLNGRSREARFAAVGLIKAVVDVGGWETLRGSEPWVRGLLSVVQKSDPIASKELAIVTLTRIYMLAHPYQTVVREIATPTIPAFITACLQLVKPPASGEPLNAPLSTVETICDALATLIPLYSTTFRPFNSQIRNAVRTYLAPTQSDVTFVPGGLQRASRRLVISLHHVAAKSGGTDEWAKLVDGSLKELHATADQVLRAVDESWEGGNGYTRANVELGDEPNGGSTSLDQLPPWTGINAGVDRLVGLFHYLSECLQCPTKSPVVIPTDTLLDAAARVCLVSRLAPKSQTWDQALQTKAAIGREEKDELWSSMPELHMAALGLVAALVKRLSKNSVPLLPEILDHLVRVFKSGISIPSVRSTGYSVLNEILPLAGPNLSKTSVDMLDTLVGACCRDLQEDAGHLKQPEKPGTSGTDAKKGSVTVNADLFLKNEKTAAVEAPRLESSHKAAATALLAILPFRLPQKHLKPSLRGLIDQTAVVTRNRDAMVASVLNPFKDQRGRIYPSILPHLTQQFPEDQGLDILRTNLRTGQQGLSNDGEPPLEELPIEDEDEDDEVMQDGDAAEEAISLKTEDIFKPGTLPAAPKVEASLAIQSNPFEPTKGGDATVYGSVGDIKPRASSPPKRKHEGADSVPPKRQVLKRSPSPELAPAPAPAAKKEDEEEEDDGDDSDVSIHLNMELEDDDEDEEDE